MYTILDVVKMDIEKLGDIRIPLRETEIYGRILEVANDLTALKDALERDMPKPGGQAEADPEKQPEEEKPEIRQAEKVVPIPEKRDEDEKPILDDYRTAGAERNENRSEAQIRAGVYPGTEPAGVNVCAATHPKTGDSATTMFTPAVQTDDGDELRQFGEDRNG